MIKFCDQVPSVYTNVSRDFQYLGHLIDIVLNSVKHNVDDIYDLPNTKIDTRLTELLAMTLGFKVKRNYDQKQLAALIAVLPRVLKYKGTETAINIIGNALTTAAGESGRFKVSVEGCELKIELPKKLIDISLFTDLLPYILPVGMTCHIIRTDKAAKELKTTLGYQDIILAEWIPDLNSPTVTGLSNMFNTSFVEADLSNFINNSDSAKLINVGLLDNNIVSAVERPMSSFESAYTEEPNDYGTTVIIHKYNENGTEVVIDS